MYARVTQFDIDTVVMPLDKGLDRFKDMVLPELRAQPGFAGISVLLNPEGRGYLISYWETKEAAEASLTGGFYDDQIRKFVTFYRQPPGREHFEVGLVEWANQTTTAAGRN